MPTPSPFPLNITLKVNSPQLLAFLAQFGESKFASAEDFNKIFQALDYLNENIGNTSQDLQEVTEIGAQTDMSMIIRNDDLDRFLAVAKGSKDLALWCDRIAHTSNGESTTQLIFEPTLIGAGIQIRNLSGTMALLSDLTAITDSIQQKVRFASQLNDVSTTSSVLLTTDLTFSVAANSEYAIYGYLTGGGSSSGGMKIGLSLPVGCTGRHSVIAMNLTTITNGYTSVIDINTIITNFAQSNNTQQTRYVATLITGANAGVLTFQFCSHSAGQQSIFKAFSHLIIIKK